MTGYNDIRTDQAEYIRELQGYLRTIQREELGYTDVPIDGIFGNRTAEAVRQTQRQLGLPVTGTVDRATWEGIYRLHREIVLRNAPPTAVYCFRTGAGPLKEGDQSDCVFILQIVLNSLQERHGNLPASEPPTGIYTSVTTESVRALQRRSGLPETGEVDKVTWDAIVELYNQR